MGQQNKDAPGIGERYLGTAEAPLASKCKVETTNEFASQVVRGTSPVRS